MSESLFILIGVSEDNARACAWILKKLFPIDIFRMFNEILMTWVLAQGVQTRFGLYATINMIVSLGVGIFAHIQYDWGIEAWLLCRAVHELIMLATVLPPFLFMTEPKTKGLVSMKQILSTYTHFVKDCCKYIVSLYSEWIGCEIAIYFTGLTHDKLQISSHTALINLSYFVMNTGIGF